MGGAWPSGPGEKPCGGVVSGGVAWSDKAVELLDRIPEWVAGERGGTEPSCAVRRGLGRQARTPDLELVARTEVAGKRGLGEGAGQSEANLASPGLVQPVGAAWQQVTDQSS